MPELLKWFDDKTDNSAWIDALAELRQRATREGAGQPRLLSQQALWRRLSEMRCPPVSTSGIRSLWAGSLFGSLGLPRIIGRGATSRGRVGWQPAHPRWHVRNGVAAGARATCKQA